MLPSLCEKFVIFLVTAEEMERTLGDLGPNNWENGIQVGLYINKLHILFFCVKGKVVTLWMLIICAVIFL